MECALWQFKDGQKALALFLSGDAATSFKESASLGAEWRIFCPAKDALLQLLPRLDSGGGALRYATSAWLKTDRRRHNLRIVSGKIECPRPASCADASRTMIVLLMQHKPLKPMMFGGGPSEMYQLRRSAGSA